MTAYEDAKGYLNVRALTCSQLTGTTQDDANFLGAWYSGWWNGHVKRHAINIDRAKKGLHEVLVYCQANPNTKVVDAVDAYVKKMQQGQSSSARQSKARQVRRLRARGPGLRSCLATRFPGK